MQLYAFDSKGEVIHARQSLKQINYYCLECQRTVRLRGGPYRQTHFYHLEPLDTCRQHQKGPTHLQLQSYFLNHLPPGDCRLEHPFPAIRRIADVAWLSQKLVFEIQCSAITGEEVLARNQDYHRMGWRVIWILHDKRYNQIRLSTAEIALRHSPHFFSNMDPSGKGIIYDQFDICNHGIRRALLPPLPISLQPPFEMLSLNKASSYPLALLHQRVLHWSISLRGDLISIFLDNPHSEYIQRAIAKEKKFQHPLQQFSWHTLPFKLWKMLISTPYQVLFRFFLERMCR